MPEDRFLAFIDGDLAAAFAHITPVCIGHFAGPVHYAAHYGYAHSFKMGCTGFHFVEGLFQIVHGPAASGAGDIFGFIELSPCGLEDFIPEIPGFLRGQAGIIVGRREVVNLPVKQFPSVGA